MNTSYNSVSNIKSIYISKNIQINAMVYAQINDWNCKSSDYYLACYPRNVP